MLLLSLHLRSSGCHRPVPPPRATTESYSSIVHRLSILAFRHESYLTIKVPRLCNLRLNVLIMLTMPLTMPLMVPPLALRLQGGTGGTSRGMSRSTTSGITIGTTVGGTDRRTVASVSESEW